MITEVSLQTLARTPRTGDEVETICSFEAGYADFIAPFFEKLNEESGELLVFINGATFGGGDLKWLSRLIRHVRGQIKPKPEAWEVSLGWQLEPPHGSRELFATVEKARFNELLGQVEAAIEQAQLQRAFVRFNFWGGAI